jgi:3-oxoacyl-[acyl-carrier-protein] synthase-1
VAPLHISAYTLTTCLGSGREAARLALLEGRSGLRRMRIDAHGFEPYVGEVEGLDGEPLPPAWSDWNCRNNRLARLALEQDGFVPAVAALRERLGAGRIGVFIGTSTSGIRETEEAYRRRDAQGRLPAGFHYRQTHACFSVADFVRHWLGLHGPAAVISTACSSSAKVFPAAARLIACGVIDAAVVGGVDTLCRTTLYGFRSLELTDPERCRPFDVDRAGISIGEAGAFALLERAPAHPRGGELLLLGAGESSDAYHMSTPHPEGLGARLAMQAALAAGHCPAADVDYVNLHGTGTRTNDAAEDKAVMAVFGDRVACSSTKGSTGHTLGAAGAVEAAIGAIALQEGLLPGGITTKRQDPALSCRFLTAPERARPRRVLSNSFGFGGTNCALLLGLADPP